MNIDDLQVGDTVTVIRNRTGHAFQIGWQVKVVRFDPDGDPVFYTEVKQCDQEWYMRPEDYAPQTEPAAEPVWNPDEGPPTDTEALNALARVMTETEDWSADTLDTIADVIRLTGRKVAEPEMPWAGEDDDS